MEKEDGEDIPSSGHVNGTNVGFQQFHAFKHHQEEATHTHTYTHTLFDVPVCGGGFYPKLEL